MFFLHLRHGEEGKARLPPGLFGEMLETFIKGFCWSTWKVSRNVASLLFQGSVIPKCLLKNYQNLTFRSSALPHRQRGMFPEGRKPFFCGLRGPRDCSQPQVLCWKLSPCHILRFYAHLVFFLWSDGKTQIALR